MEGFSLWRMWVGGVMIGWGVVVGVFVIEGCLRQVGGEGEVRMVDMGEGESMYVRGRGENGRVLIDRGGRVSLGKEGWRKGKKDF